MSEKTIAPAVGDAYELGEWMGRKQAFAPMAGRCSAAAAPHFSDLHVVP